MAPGIYQEVHPYDLDGSGLMVNKTVTIRRRGANCAGNMPIEGCINWRRP